MLELDSVKIVQNTAQNSSLVQIRIPGDPRWRHGRVCGSGRSHHSIGNCMFLTRVLGAPDTDNPRDAKCVAGPYFPRRKDSREVPPPPSNYPFTTHLLHICYTFATIYYPFATMYCPFDTMYYPCTTIYYSFATIHYPLAIHWLPFTTHLLPCTTQNPSLPGSNSQVLQF